MLALLYELPYSLKWYLLATREHIRHIQYVDMLFWDASSFCCLKSIFEERDAGLGPELARDFHWGETWGSSQK